MKDCRRNRGRQRAPIVVPTVLVDSLRPLPRELGCVAVYAGKTARGLCSRTQMHSVREHQHLTASEVLAKAMADTSAVLSNNTVSFLMRSLGSVLWILDLGLRSGIMNH